MNLFWTQELKAWPVLISSSRNAPDIASALVPFTLCSKALS